MKRLILCEKPSVARAVAIGLGVKMTGGRPFTSEEWIIESARGHLLQLAYPEEYDPALERWRAEDLPVIPDEFRWEPRKESEELLERVVELIRSPEVSEVVNACDAGREGELIFKLIYRAAGVEKPVRRAWFSSLTPGAVRRAFEGLRDDREMKGLEAAAFARDVGDWLIGINGTRAATVRSAEGRPDDAPGRTVSVGRVQTPTLRILAEREDEVDAYVPIPYYRIRGHFGAGAAPMEALLTDGGEEPVRFEEEAGAAALAGALEGKPVAVRAHEVERVERAAPLPYDLATLQVEASRAFGWSAARTLREAQNLYERQFISYPRTDSRFLTWDLKGQVIEALGRVHEVLPELEGAASALARAADEGTLPGRPFNAALVRDHHAIIPTGKSGAADLSESQGRLYALVARRFVAAFFPPSIEEHTTLGLEVEGRVFEASGRRVVEEGWREVEPGREPTEPAVLEALAAIGSGREEVSLASAEVEMRHPRRPRPHTDGSLIRAMERAGEAPEPPATGGDEEDSAEEGDDAGDSGRHIGIGTPATRSAIIETLIDRRYALRHRSWIYATARGRRLVAILDDLDLTSPELTAAWEERLDRIREGAESAEAFRRELEELTRSTVEAILARPMERLFDPPEPLGPCPRCGGTVVERDRAYGCDSWSGDENPGCGWVVFRELQTGRVGRAEAEWRLAQDRPHATARPVSLPPGVADPEAMPEGMVAYEVASGPEAPLEEPAAGEEGEKATEAWARAVEEVVEVEGPVMVRRILAVLGPHVQGMSPRKARSRVNRTTAALVREGALVEVDDGRTVEGQQDKVVKVPGQPEVQMRERGPRDPLEIPQREVRSVARALGLGKGGEGAVEAVARAFAIEGEKLTEDYRGWIAGAMAALVTEEA